MHELSKTQTKKEQCDSASSFEIATVTYAAKGRIGISAMPGLHGTLDADVSDVQRWGAQVVVTMTTLDELEKAGATALGLKIAAHGISWLHIPVPNYGGLEHENAQNWPVISQKLHQVLRQGDNVLVHCRGGHGRSGMIAMRLLVEQGESSDSALERIRAARPGAIETEEQMAWAQLDPT